MKDLKDLIVLKNELTDYHVKLDDIYRASTELEVVTINHLKEYIESIDSFIFVAEDNGKLVGYIAGSIRDDYYRNVNKAAKIKNFLIAKEYRNKKIGKSLFNKTKEYLKKMGVDYLEVSVDINNEKTTAAYKKLGFIDHSLTLNQKL